MAKDVQGEGGVLDRHTGGRRSARKTYGGRRSARKTYRGKEEC